MNRFLIICIFSSLVILVPSCVHDAGVNSENKDASKDELFGNAVQNELSQDFNILVWNIKKGKYQNFLKEFSSLAKGKDLLLLQEAKRNDKTVEQAYKLKIDEGYEFYMAISFSNNGVTTGSKIKSNKRYYLKSPYREIGITTPKVMVFTHYPIKNSDQTLLVVNIHAINVVTSKMFQKHIQQAEAAIASHNGPVIFAGDFNTNKKKKVTYLNDLVKRLDMTKVVFDPDVRQGEGANCFKDEIDYVFIKGLSYLKARVLNTFKGSDHCPMEVSLGILN